MTESEWLSGRQPKKMLNFVRDSASDRKLRLFVCGYLRSLLQLYDEDSICVALESLETSERFADCLASAEELGFCRRKARAAAKDGNEAAKLAIHYAAFLNVARAVEQVFGHITTESNRRIKVQLLHDLWGPLPFRRLHINPHSLATRVVDLAKQIYDNRAYHQMPILADALEETGCHDNDIFGHCRSAGPHFRGCWVLDAILVKM